MEGDAPVRLILDTAYVSLLRSRRQRIHDRSGRTRAVQFSEL